jgi:hypothetical protein
MIYRYVMAPSRRHSLFTVRFPTLVATSRMVRPEALSLFFAEGHSDVKIGTNLYEYVDRRHEREWTNLTFDGRDMDLIFKRAGKLDINPVVEKSVRSAGDRVLFRHITFKVTNARGEAQGMGYRRFAGDPKLSISLDWSGRADPHVDFKCPDLEEYSGKEEVAQLIDSVRAAAMKVAERKVAGRKVARRRSSSGFTLQELR